ncbi:hypothetical protein Tco_0991312 [Tanacetum coccineum]|uniref:Uncharacterized protein n=1 Tax=Tanacetum coccineum TaxID=301880 RepID=A0ABQ5EZQ6_9ASTR
MAKTMEQYMSKIRADYGSGISRPKIDDKDSFELKGQFLKELRDNTFSEIKKVNEKVYASQRFPTQGRRQKPSKKLTTLNLVDHSKEGDIEQQLWDSTRGTVQTLHIKNEDNLWKRP